MGSNFFSLFDELALFIRLARDELRRENSPRHAVFPPFFFSSLPPLFLFGTLRDERF